MGYIGLIALVLGLISIIVTVKYVDSYDKLNYTLKKNCSNNKLTKFPNILIDIQDKLDLTDNDFLDILGNKKDEIVKLLKGKKKETFTNYMPYIESKKRNINKKELSGLINQYSTQKIVTSFSYKNNKELAKKAISRQQTYNIFPKYIILNKNKEKFIKRNLCLVNHDGKNYCYPTREKEFCPGIYGKGFAECKEKNYR